MRIAAFVVLLFTLMSSVESAGGCYVTVAEYEDLSAAFDRVGTPALMDRDPFEAGKFLGYLLGLLDKGDTLLFCLDIPLNIQDVRVVVTRHLQDAMKEFDLLPTQTCASAVIELILIRRFPCNPQPKPDAETPAK